MIVAICKTKGIEVIAVVRGKDKVDEMKGKFQLKHVLDMKDDQF